MIEKGQHDPLTAERCGDSEPGYRAFFNSAPEAVCLIERLPLRADGRRDYRYVAMNPAMQTMFGIGDLTGQTIRDNFPDEMEVWYDDYDRVLDTGEPLRFERESTPQGIVLEMSLSRIDAEPMPQLLVVMQDVTQRTRAEARLRSSEARYRQLFESMGQGYAEIELVRDASGKAVDYRYIELNPAFLRFSGISVETARGRLATEVFPGIEAYWIDSFDHIVKSGKPERLEYEVGVLGKWFELYANPVGPDRLIGLYEDISDRKRVELELRRSEEQQAFLLDLSDKLRTEPDAEAVANLGVRMLGKALNLDCCYIALLSLADDRADMPYQYRREGFAPLPLTVSLRDFPDTIKQAAGGTTILEDVPTDPRLSAADKQNLMAIGLRSIVVASLRKGENNPIWALVTVKSQPARWTKGEVALIEDVAERIWAAVERARSESAVRDSEARWRLMADAMPNLVFVADASAGELTYINDPFRKYTGKALEDMFDRGWMQLVHPDDTEAVTRAWAFSRKAYVTLDTECRLRGADGTFRWFQVRAVPAPHGDFAARLWFGACADIQNLMEARFHAESADRAKTEFLANMSHEIRTPLNAVVGLTSLMLDYQPTPEKQQQFLRTMRDSANNLQAIINDVLEYAKLDAGMVELHESETDLSALLDEVLRITAVKGAEKGLQMQAHDFTDKSSLILDPLRIKQILLNLLSNAVKFTDRGSISIVAAVVDVGERSLLTLSVRDTGIGIAAENLDRIFSKFNQADNTITRRFGGTGLGLAISRRLAQTMGGSLEVTSRLEEGSAFTLTVPVHRANRPAVLSVVAKTSATERPLNVLLVEDNPTNSLVAENMLSVLGHSFVTAANGFQAIDRWKSDVFDVVLMDIQMPDMDGITATKRIRQAERETGQEPVRIIAVSAHAIDTDRRRAIEAGMDDFLGKPFTASELREKLA